MLTKRSCDTTVILVFCIKGLFDDLVDQYKNEEQNQTSSHGDKPAGTFAGTNAEHKSVLLGLHGNGREG